MGSTSFTNKVVGIFADSVSANNALNDLNANGFDSSNISVLARDYDESERIVSHSSATLDRPDVINTSTASAPIYTDRAYTDTTVLHDNNTTVDRMEQGARHIDDRIVGRDVLNNNVDNNVDRYSVLDRAEDGLRHADDAITGRDSLGNNRDFDRTVITTTETPVTSYNSPGFSTSQTVGDKLENVAHNTGSAIRNTAHNVADGVRHMDDAVTGRDSFGNNKDYISDTSYPNNGEVLVGSDRAADIASGHDVAEKDPRAMVKGATAGGALGLIAGLGALLIPGIGPVLAAGPLAAAITAAAGGAAIGATAGTLLGILNDEGIPSDRADFYNRHFNKGNIIVMVHTDEGHAARAREILVKHNPETIDTF